MTENITGNTTPPASPRLDRRQLGAAVLAGGLLAAGAAAAQPGPGQLPEGRMPRRPDAEPPITVAMLVHPRMILLDLAGPQTVLTVLGADIHLVGETMAPVSTDVGISVTPTTTWSIRTSGAAAWNKAGAGAT